MSDYAKHQRLAPKPLREYNRNEGRKWVQKYKRRRRCAKCKSKRGLTFHHCNPEKKKDNVSNMVRLGLPLRVIRKEVDKCIVLCVTCHRAEHIR